MDELESEASAEEISDQTGNSLSDNCSSESSSTGKKMNSGYDLDMIEIETAEIAVDNKEQSVQKNEITDSKNSADSGEKKAGSVENSDEDAETLEIFLPGKSVSNVENEDSTQQKKGFFSKIRKKKNEESEE